MPANRALIAVLLLSLALGACAGRERGDDGTRSRDRAEARRQIERGNAAFLDGDLEAAARRYRAALRADAFSGVAYNNLGRVYYKQRRLYAAAQAFDRAARLLPHHAEPRNNLGLVLESAGRFDEALDAYDRALAHEPDHPQVLGNRARTLVRRGDEGEEVRELLQRITLEDDRPRWREWARLTLIKLDDGEAEDAAAE